MSDFLEKLFHTTKAKDFVTLFKEAEEKYENPQEFLSEAAAYLPVRLYEHYYENTVPHSFFGLASASLVQPLFPEEARWQPFVQQSWFVTRERKRTALNIDAIEVKREGSLEERWQQFEQAADNANFEDAFAWAKGFLKEEADRRFFRQKSLAYAMEDTFHGGHKFLYLFQVWRMAEALNWNHVENIICPALHFLVLGPKDRSLSKIVQEYWRQNPLTSFLENKGGISNQSYDKAETAVLFGDQPGDSLHMLRTLSDSGVSLEATQEALLASAAQALSNSDAGKWIWPMRAFHFGCFIRHLSDTEPQQKTYALMMAAALLGQASARSRGDLEQNRQLDEVARQLCPIDPFNVLRSVISHTDPYASATAVYAILGMDEDKKKELLQTLLSLAVKNDGAMCYGHDILYVYEVSDCYKRLNLEQKDKLPVSAGFFLGRVRKKYELFGAYGF
ncbi:MAG: hypothetical protein ACE5MK_05675 [Acidobacteriota bacterium]